MGLSLSLAIKLLPFTSSNISGSTAAQHKQFVTVDNTY